MNSTSPIPTPRRQWLTLAAVALGVFVTTLDNTVVNVALPTSQQDLGLGLAGLAWVVNGYILSFAVLLLTGVRVGQPAADVRAAEGHRPRLGLARDPRPPRRGDGRRGRVRADRTPRAAPSVDLSLFRIPAFSGASAAILVFNLGTFGVFLYTSLYFQRVLGYSPVTAGAALLPWVLMLIAIGPFTGALSQRVAPRVLIAGGLAVMAGGLVLLSGIDEHSAYPALLPGLVVGGIGGALTIPLNAVAIGAAPVECSGVASDGLLVAAGLAPVAAVVVLATLRPARRPFSRAATVADSM